MLEFCMFFKFECSNCKYGLCGGLLCKVIFIFKFENEIKLL